MFPEEREKVITQQSNVHSTYIPIVPDGLYMKGRIAFRGGWTKSDTKNMFDRLTNQRTHERTNHQAMGLDNAIKDCGAQI